MTYCCMLSSNDYLDGVLVINECLKKVNSKYKLICLINENINDEIKYMLKEFDIKYIERKSIKNNNYTLDKINLFSLTEYEKIVYLDSDMFVLENIDELFKIDSFAMVKNNEFKNSIYCSSLMVLKPDEQIYNDLKKMVLEIESIDETELFKKYFKTINQVSSIYNLMLQIIDEDYPFFDNITNKIERKQSVLQMSVDVFEPKIIHYIGELKPFDKKYNCNDCYLYLYYYYLNDIKEKKYKIQSFVKNKKISIIVPIYNKKKYLNKCVDSIINQTYKNLEIILVDDCSTDNSLEICKSYESLDSRIIVLHQEQNQGVSAARNRGLEVATGDYIGFVDADDYIKEEMYEKLLINMFKYDADFVQCATIFNEEPLCIHGKTIFYENNKDIFKVFLNTEAITYTIWDKLFTKEILKNEFFDVELCNHEDSLFVINIIKKCNRVCITNDLLYYYEYQKPKSLTGKINLEKNLAIIKCNKIVENIINKKYPELRYDFNNYRLNRLIYIFEKMRKYYLFENNEKIKYFMQYIKDNYEELIDCDEGVVNRFLMYYEFFMTI